MPAVVVDETPGAHLNGHPSLAALETLLQKVESTTAAAAESTRTHTDFRRLHHDPVCAVASVVARRLKQSIGGHAAAIAAAEAARSGSLADGVRLPELDMAPLLVTPFTGPLETLKTAIGEAQTLHRTSKAAVAALGDLYAVGADEPWATDARTRDQATQDLFFLATAYHAASTAMVQCLTATVDASFGRMPLHTLEEGTASRETDGHGMAQLARSQASTLQRLHGEAAHAANRTRESVSASVVEWAAELARTAALLQWVRPLQTRRVQCAEALGTLGSLRDAIRAAARGAVDARHAAESLEFEYSGAGIGLPDLTRAQQKAERCQAELESLKRERDVTMAELQWAASGADISGVPHVAPQGGGAASPLSDDDEGVDECCFPEVLVAAVLLFQPTVRNVAALSDRDRAEWEVKALLRRLHLLEENRTLDDYTTDGVPPVVAAQGKTHVRVRRLRGDGGIKVLKEYTLSDFKLIKRAVATAHGLRHPAIVAVECAFVTDDTVVVQSPFYKGGDMRQWARGKEPCDVLLALWRVAESLEFLHQNKVLHRDIKPGNIVFESDGPLARPALCDFDIAISTDETQTSLGPSTFLYMPPELDATPAGDVYSFGVTIIDAFFCSSDVDRIPKSRTRYGIFAFDVGAARTMLQHHTNVALAALVGAMLRDDADARPPIAEVVSQLHPLVEAALRDRDQQRDASRQRIDDERVANHASELRHVEHKLARAKYTAPHYWSSRDVDQLARRTVGSKFMAHRLQELMVKATQHAACGRGQLGKARVVKVERIENSELWTAFATRRSILTKRVGAQAEVDRVVLSSAHSADFLEDCSQEVNEVYLFHGTSPQNAAIITRHGFDERVASMQGLYGAGTYFAEDSCKAHQYARPNSKGEFVMFYSRVLLGVPEKVLAGKAGARRASEIPGSGGRTFDSVIAGRDARGGNQQHREFIVYDSTQAYPEFLIYYKCDG